MEWRCQSTQKLPWFQGLFVCKNLLLNWLIRLHLLAQRQRQNWPRCAVKSFILPQSHNRPLQNNSQKDEWTSNFFIARTFWPPLHSFRNRFQLAEHLQTISLLSQWIPTYARNMSKAQKYETWLLITKNLPLYKAATHAHEDAKFPSDAVTYYVGRFFSLS